MKKVLIATDKPFAPEAVAGIREIIEKVGYKLELLEGYQSQSDFVKAATDVDAIIIRSDKADKEVIESSKNLKIIVRAGAGYDNIDLEAATKKGIVAMNTPGQNSNAVAELVFGMMIYNARKFFTGKAGTEIKGKKIGIHAYGNIGKIVARIAKGFGMTVLAYDPFVSKETIEKDGVIVVDTIEELYSQSNFVSLHIPANDKTKKSINFDLLNKMPKGGVLINTARKEVINEEDLLKIFETRPDFTYLSDIAPDCKSEIDKRFEGRYFFSPKKMGAQTEEANVNAGLAAANQIVDFFENGNTKFKVN